MIKINLLPTKKKKSRKITELQQQLILACLVLVLLGLGMFLYYKSLNNKIVLLSTAKRQAEAKIREQDNMLKEVKSVEDERKQVTDKIGIIEQLKNNQTLLVHLLDQLSKALPQGVNVTSLSENNGLVNLEGTAFTNNDVVHFVDNLKATSGITDVFLQETVESPQEGIEAYKYRLTFSFKGV